MQQMVTFVPSDPAPSWWANSVMRSLSTMTANFAIVKQTATTIRGVAAANDKAAVIAIAGKWRWRESNVDRAHPGGAAGTYDIFVTAANNVIGGAVDSTNYAWDLAITVTGVNPVIVPGTVDIYRKVGYVVWDGAAITKVVQTVPPIRLHAQQHLAGGEDPLPAEILNFVLPVGAQLAGSWSTLPTGWAWADGGLVAAAAFPVFDAMAGAAAPAGHTHKYNVGVPPGGGNVRKPDKRGRVTVGADDMGTGAAGRLPNSARTWGSSGGEERHLQTLAELRAHVHNLGIHPNSNVTGIGFNVADADPNFNQGAGTASAGGSTPFNVMQPYEVDGVIVRLA